jgi:hypothetical protein
MFQVKALISMPYMVQIISALKQHANSISYLHLLLFAKSSPLPCFLSPPGLCYAIMCKRRGRSLYDSINCSAPLAIINLLPSLCLEPLDQCHDLRPWGLVIMYNSSLRENSCADPILGHEFYIHFHECRVAQRPPGFETWMNDGGWSLLLLSWGWNCDGTSLLL